MGTDVTPQQRVNAGERDAQAHADAAELVVQHQAGIPYLAGERCMKYEEFQDWVEKNCLYEAFYEDTQGRIILVITGLDAWVMCNKFAKANQEEEKNT